MVPLPNWDGLAELIVKLHKGPAKLGPQVLKEVLRLKGVSRRLFPVGIIGEIIPIQLPIEGKETITLLPITGSHGPTAD